MALLWHVTAFNAISSMYGVLAITTYFFESLGPDSLGAAAAAVCPLAAEEEDLGQSQAI